jgi:chromosome segregation ATPase
MTDIAGFITLSASIVAVVGSLAALVIAWRKAPAEKRKMNADAESAISGAAVSLIEPLQKRIEELEAAREKDRTKMTSMESRISVLECEVREERSEKEAISDGARKLMHQVESYGGVPVYRPPERGGRREA